MALIRGLVSANGHPTMLNKMYVTQHMLLTYLLTYLLHGAESLKTQLVLQLVKKFPAFLEPEGSSPYSQVPATCPYPEPTPSSPHNLTPLPEDPSQRKHRAL